MLINETCIHKCSRCNPIYCSRGDDVGANVAFLIGLGDLKIYVTMKCGWWQLLYLVWVCIIPDDIGGMKASSIIG
jgi:hypothetical protein